MAAYKLVLIRHGESNWNQENRFCGWFDADLSETGVQEAKRGGQALKGEEELVLYCNNGNASVIIRLNDRIPVFSWLRNSLRLQSSRPPLSGPWSDDVQKDAFIVQRHAQSCCRPPAKRILFCYLQLIFLFIMRSLNIFRKNTHSKDKGLSNVLLILIVMFYFICLYSYSLRCWVWVWHLPHLCAETGHQDTVASPGQHWPDVAARPSYLAP